MHSFKLYLEQQLVELIVDLMLWEWLAKKMMEVKLNKKQQCKQKWLDKLQKLKRRKEDQKMMQRRNKKKRKSRKLLQENNRKKRKIERDKKLKLLRDSKWKCKRLKRSKTRNKHLDQLISLKKINRREMNSLIRMKIQSQWIDNLNNNLIWTKREEHSLKKQRN